MDRFGVSGVKFKNAAGAGGGGRGQDTGALGAMGLDILKKRQKPKTSTSLPITTIGTVPTETPLGG